MAEHIDLPLEKSDGKPTGSITPALFDSAYGGLWPRKVDCNADEEFHPQSSPPNQADSRFRQSIMTLAASTDAAERAEAASSDNVPPDTLLKLSKDPSEDVRMAAAENLHLPAD